jgi:phosphatidylserine decarboxylase
MRNTNTHITSEGYPYIAGFAAAAAISALLANIVGHACFWYAIAGLFALLTLFTLYFFRNPERNASCDENIVIAPADGRVIVCERVLESPTGKCALKISIFMSVFDVHINRIPITGKIAAITHRPGAFFDARHKRASFENESNTVLLETASGVRIALVQIAGLIARRIVCYPVVGDVLTRGVRYGMIRFGSRVDLYLPEDLKPLVKLGDRTIAGVTPMGRIV